MNARTSFRRPRLGVEPLEDRLLMMYDCFLKIDGVDGESRLDSFIEVQSWSLGQVNPPGGGGSTSMNDFHFILKPDAASAQLLQACCTGEHFKAAKLTFLRSGGDGPSPYMTFKMKDVFITSYQLGGDHGVPTDSLSFNFQKVRANYFGPGGTLENSWVLKDGDQVNPTRTRVAVGDVNGDGKADIFQMQDMNGDKRREMTGAVAGVVDTPQLPPQGIALQMKGPPAATPAGQYPEVKLFDSDGDGKPEQWWVTFGPKGPRIIFIDKDENGRPETIGIDLDADGRTEAALWDNNGDGRMDTYWMDLNGNNDVDPGETGQLPQF